MTFQTIRFLLYLLTLIEICFAKFFIFNFSVTVLVFGRNILFMSIFKNNF